MKMFLRKQQLTQPSQFLARLSTLLEEGYTFDESVNILSPFHVKDEHSLREKLKQSFLTGGSPEEILQLIGIGKRYLLSISIANSTGDLASALKKISEEMAFNEKLSERFKRLLYYPVFLFVFIVCLFMAYRQLFLPRMSTLLTERSSTSDILSLKLTNVFLSVPDYFFYTALFIIGVCALFFYFTSRKDVRKQVEIYRSLPIVKRIFTLMISKQLARQLGNLLLHGFSLQDALTLLQKQPHNRILALIAGDLLIEVLNGETLSVAIRKTDYLANRFEPFIVHGERSGMLDRELIIFADLLEEKFQAYVQTSMKIVQPTLLAIIAICVLAAYLSILLPIYNMIEFV